MSTIKHVGIHTLNIANISKLGELIGETRTYDIKAKIRNQNLCPIKCLQFLFIIIYLFTSSFLLYIYIYLYIIKNMLFISKV